MTDISCMPDMTLDDIERMVITSRLNFMGGNRNRTADSLGIAVKTLFNKLERYELEDMARSKQAEERRAANQEYLARARGLAVPQMPVQVQTIKAEVQMTNLRKK